MEKLLGEIIIIITTSRHKCLSFNGIKYLIELEN